MASTATDRGIQGSDSSKGDRTRSRILEAATQLFAERGYDGAGIRDIESAAGVKRGVVTYHFGCKEDIWKAMFAYSFLPLLEDLQSKTELLRALDPHVRAQFLIENLIRTSAARPYMNQLMIQENFTKSWRSEWIIKTLLKPLRELNEEIAGDDPFLQMFERDPHLRYAVLGACNMVFSHRCEVEDLFDEDVADEDFVDRHVAMVMGLLECYMNRVKQSEGTK